MFPSKRLFNGQIKTTRKLIDDEDADEVDAHISPATSMQGSVSNGLDSCVNHDITDLGDVLNSINKQLQQQNVAIAEQSAKIDQIYQKLFTRTPEIFKFPLDNFEDMDELDAKLGEDESFEINLKQQLARTIRGKISSNLSIIISDSLLPKINWDGKKGKTAIKTYNFFNITLYECLHEMYTTFAEYELDMKDGIRKGKNRLDQKRYKSKTVFPLDDSENMYTSEAESASNESFQMICCEEKHSIGNVKVSEFPLGNDEDMDNVDAERSENEEFEMNVVEKNTHSIEYNITPETLFPLSKIEVIFELDAKLREDEEFEMNLKQQLAFRITGKISSNLSIIISDSLLPKLNWDGRRRMLAINKFKFFDSTLYQCLRENYATFVEYVKDIKEGIKKGKNRLDQKRYKSKTQFPKRKIKNKDKLDAELGKGEASEINLVSEKTHSVGDPDTPDLYMFPLGTIEDMDLLDARIEADTAFEMNLKQQLASKIEGRISTHLSIIISDSLLPKISWNGIKGLTALNTYTFFNVILYHCLHQKYPTFEDYVNDLKEGIRKDKLLLFRKRHKLKTVLPKIEDMDELDDELGEDEAYEINLLRVKTRSVGDPNHPDFFMFPLDKIEDMEKLDARLDGDTAFEMNLKQQLASKIEGKISSNLSVIISDNLLLKVNWNGKKGMKALNTYTFFNVILYHCLHQMYDSFEKYEKDMKQGIKKGKNRLHQKQFKMKAQSVADSKRRRKC